MTKLQQLRKDVALAVTIARKRPFNVFIQVTNRCNMRCDFCTFWSNGAHPREELTVADYRRLADELAGIGHFMVSIEGGEPFNRSDILAIVATLSRHHTCVMYTNGWYIDAARARALFASGLTQIGVSIDFPDARRHDAKRGLPGTTERAWQAVELLRDAAPRGGRQVHVMTVYMDENRQDLEALLQQSQRRGVGHCITLLATQGTRRAPGGSWPEELVSDHLLDLWRRYPHFRAMRDYLGLMDTFLTEGDMPTCHAGRQSFNIDHLGNVAPCIEKIAAPVGNVRTDSLAELLARMRTHPEVAGCQECWTLCRGMSQLLGQRGRPRAWLDMAIRMRG